jgi:hypothetical protein
LNSGTVVEPHLQSELQTASVSDLGKQWDKICTNFRCKKLGSFHEVTSKTILCYGGTQSGTSLLCLALQYSILLSSPTIPVAEFIASSSPRYTGILLQICSFWWWAEFVTSVAVSSEYAKNEEQAEKDFYSAIRRNPISTLKFSPSADRSNSDQSAVEVERKNYWASLLAYPGKIFIFFNVRQY